MTRLLSREPMGRLYRENLRFRYSYHCDLLCQQRHRRHVREYPHVNRRVHNRRFDISRNLSFVYKDCPFDTATVHRLMENTLVLGRIEPKPKVDREEMEIFLHTTVQCLTTDSPGTYMFVFDVSFTQLAGPIYFRVVPNHRYMGWGTRDYILESGHELIEDAVTTFIRSHMEETQND